MYRKALALGALGLLSSCQLGENFKPAPPIEITIDFCDHEAPIWFAHQSGSEAWQVGGGGAGATYTFTAAGQTAIAFVRQREGLYRTEVIFTNALDLEDVSNLQCAEEQGTKEVHGTVAGLADPQVGLVAMNFANAYVTATQNSYTLSDLVNQPLDLIASRIDFVTDAQHANKIIIRRALNPTNGATLTALNFDSEGFQPPSHTASVTGVGANDFAYLVNNFFSQLETSHVLSTVDGITDGLTSFVAVPTNQLATRDYHDLFVVATSPTGSVRGIEQFFTTPANQSLILGPDLVDPIVTTISTDPHVRMRTELDGQFDYSTVVSTEYRQQTQFFTIEFLMTVSASYLGGTPFVWDIPMPNFSGLDEFNEAWTLQPGVIDWTVTAYYGRPSLLFGARPENEERIVYASQSGSTSATAQPFRVGRVPPRRPIIGRWR